MFFKTEFNDENLEINKTFSNMDKFFPNNESHSFLQVKKTTSSLSLDVHNLYSQVSECDLRNHEKNNDELIGAPIVLSPLNKQSNYNSLSRNLLQKSDLTVRNMQSAGNDLLGMKRKISIDFLESWNKCSAEETRIKETKQANDKGSQRKAHNYLFTVNTNEIDNNKYENSNIKENPFNPGSIEISRKHDSKFDLFNNDYLNESYIEESKGSPTINHSQNNFLSFKDAYDNIYSQNNFSHFNDIFQDKIESNFKAFNTSITNYNIIEQQNNNINNKKNKLFTSSINAKPQVNNNTHNRIEKFVILDKTKYEFNSSLTTNNDGNNNNNNTNNNNTDVNNSNDNNTYCSSSGGSSNSNNNITNPTNSNFLALNSDIYSNSNNVFNNNPHTIGKSTSTRKSTLKEFKYQQYLDSLKNKKPKRQVKKIDKRNAYKPTNIIFYLTKEKQILPNPEERTKKPCNCKQTKCIKLYCDCFNSGKYCVDCDCVECFNIPEYSEIRNKALDHIEKKTKSNSITDFTDKKKIVDSRGCNCKNTNCLKSYCECFRLGQGCAPLCKCEGCLNDGNLALASKERRDKAKKRISKTRRLRMAENANNNVINNNYNSNIEPNEA